MTTFFDLEVALNRGLEVSMRKVDSSRKFHVVIASLESSRAGIGESRTLVQAFDNAMIDLRQKEQSQKKKV